MYISPHLFMQEDMDFDDDVTDVDDDDSQHGTEDVDDGITHFILIDCWSEWVIVWLWLIASAWHVSELRFIMKFIN